MENMNRRELCVALTSLAALTAVSAEAQTGGAGALPQTMAVPAPPGSAGDPVLATQQAFLFEALPVAKSANGETRTVVRGVLPTGEAVELHETTLLPGHSPHPPHKHRHSEFMLVREGTVEFNNDGKPERAGPGGVFLAASNVLHGLTNVGAAPANYFVMAIGRETTA